MNDNFSVGDPSKWSWCVSDSITNGKIPIVPKHELQTMTCKSCGSTLITDPAHPVIVTHECPHFTIWG